MFVGTFENKIDQKGRVSIPRGFRKSLVSQSVVLSIDKTIGALVGFDPSRLEKTPPDDDDQFYQTAETRKFDASGRMVVPNTTLEAVHLEDRALFLGLGDTFQIWNPDRYKRFSASTNASGDESVLASSWTGIRTFQEKVRFLNSIAPHVIQELSNWIDECEARLGNNPPYSLFPTDLLNDLKLIRNDLSDVIEAIETGKISEDKFRSFARHTGTWILDYKRILATAGADTLHALPPLLAVVGLAEVVGLLDDKGSALAIGTISGALASNIAGGVRTQERSKD